MTTAIAQDAPPVVQTILEQMPEAAALVTLVRACDGAADPVTEVGPIANHLLGRTAAERPDYHDHPSGVPEWPDALTRHACSMGWDEPIRPHHDGLNPPSELLHVVPGLGECAVSRPPRQDPGTAAAVEAAILSGDPDEAMPVLDGRVACLMRLADRARAASGGKLDPETVEAVQTLAACLLGSTRWNVIHGWETGHEWPVPWRFGAAAVRAHIFLCQDEIGRIVTRRMVEDR